MHPNCMPNSMILAQNEFCQNVNQVIHTLNTICMPNIMTLAQAVLQTFCSQGSIGVYTKVKKGHNSAMTSLMEKKKKGSAYFSCLVHILNFKILSLTLLDHVQSITDIVIADRQTDQNQYAPSLWHNKIK